MKGTGKMRDGRRKAAWTQSGIEKWWRGQVGGGVPCTSRAVALAAQPNSAPSAAWAVSRRAVSMAASAVPPGWQFRRAGGRLLYSVRTGLVGRRGGGVLSAPMAPIALNRFVPLMLKAIC